MEEKQKDQQRRMNTGCGVLLCSREWFQANRFNRRPRVVRRECNRRSSGAGILVDESV